MDRPLALPFGASSSTWPYFSTPLPMLMMHRATPPSLPLDFDCATASAGRRPSQETDDHHKGTGHEEIVEA